MGDEGKFLNFVTEKEVNELRELRGDRVEDGTIAPDRPLFEVLKEQKEKKEAEFNERFRNLPPKALDDDETEFLDACAKQKRDIEKEVEEEELRELTNFQAAILGRTLHLPEPAPLPRKQERKEHNEKEKVRATTAKRAAAPPPIIIRVQPKRARGETTSLSGKKSIQQQGGLAPPKPSIEQAVAAGGLAGLASYDSEEDNDE